MNSKPLTVNAPEPERQNDGLWKTRDVADFLKVSTQTVRKMVERQELPYVRIGPNTLRYDPAAIRRWFDEKQAEAA